MQNNFTEIERKFLIDSFPTDLPLKEHFQVYQAYLSINPEVRLRRNAVDGQDIAYFLAIKSSGELVRQEIELSISKEHFDALAQMVTQPFILKDFCIYQLPNGLELECSHVDEGRATEFMYAEVEFPNVEAAQSFIPLPNFTEDVTKNPAYKMKNYWRWTRLAPEAVRDRSKVQRVGEFEKVSLVEFSQAIEPLFGAVRGFDIHTVDQVYNALQLPARATSGSAGYDFKAPFDFTLAPGESIKLPTGIRVKINDGWWLACVPRSGLGFKYRVQLDNTIGVVDSDYYNSDNEGHIFAKITNDSKENKTVTVKAGEAFMQALFLPFGLTYSDTANGIRNGGMGSTDRQSVVEFGSAKAA